MGLQIGFDKAVTFTKFTVYLACTWPLPRSATKWQIITYNIRWCISFINTACIFLGLVFSIRQRHDNLLVVTQSACFCGSTAGLMIKMIAFRTQLKTTQTRIEEMEDFLKTARPHEIAVLRRYLAKFLSIHVLMCILTYLAASLTRFVPLLLHNQPLPSMAFYPFSVDSGIVKCLAFIQQSVVAYQCSAGSAVSCQSALMMWFAGARLEILAEETKSISSADGIPDFVVKHNDRLTYAIDVSKAMRYVALAGSMASGLTVIMSSLISFSNQPLGQKMQFAPLMVGGLLNLFVCAWPADNLINVCYSMGNVIYNIAWFDMSVSTRKNLIMIIQRCQRPIIVSVGGLLPTVSLRSYAAFLSAVFSYFMTLRAATSDGGK